MTTSPKTYSPFTIDLEERDFSDRELTYLEQRALNNVYDFVVRKFLNEQANTGLSKAELARRIKRGPDQVTRWLASPSNWTIGTVQRLLAGISGDELFVRTEPFAGRKPQNMTTYDLLGSDTDQVIPRSPQVDSAITDSGASLLGYQLEYS